MTIWFTSDQHFGHKNILLPTYCDRPFVDVDDMNRGLIERHNSVVKDSDEVWHIGDFSLNEKFVPLILPQLKGAAHHIVVGNHDGAHIRHKKYEVATKRYLDYGFKSVHQEVRNFERKFLLNHLPYLNNGDSKHEARFPEYRPKDTGGWLLHGHVHKAWKVNKRMINCGVDVHDYFPVALETLLEITK